MSDRIYIMNDGRMVGEVSAEEASQELIMSRILLTKNSQNPDKEMTETADTHETEEMKI